MKTAVLKKATLASNQRKVDNLETIPAGTKVTVIEDCGNGLCYVSHGKLIGQTNTKNLKGV